MTRASTSSPSTVSLRPTRPNRRNRQDAKTPRLRDKEAPPPGSLRARHEAKPFSSSPWRLGVLAVSSVTSWRLGGSIISSPTGSPQEMQKEAKEKFLAPHQAQVEMLGSVSS